MCSAKQTDGEIMDDYGNDIFYLHEDWCVTSISLSAYGGGPWWEDVPPEV